jgi:hypothetical protein
MKDIESHLGISRSEYMAGVRLCPKHPAFAGTYEDWIEANLEVVRKIAAKRYFLAGTTRAAKQR